MSESHQEHDQEDNQNHDDCEDCRRERAENQTLINMYEKLQEVEKKTSTVKSDLIKHQNSVKEDKSKIQKIQDQVTQVKGSKGSQNKKQFENMGYSLFSELLESSLKMDIQKQNKRLRMVLSNIYQQRQRNRQNGIKQNKFIDSLKLDSKIENSLQSSKWFETNTFSHQTPTTNNMVNEVNEVQQKSQKNQCQITSTKSTFSITKRKSFGKKDFQDLNLWLFEDKNEVLEQQLYSPKIKQPLLLSGKKATMKIIGEQTLRLRNNSSSRYNNNSGEYSSFSKTNNDSLVMSQSQSKRKPSQSVRLNSFREDQKTATSRFNRSMLGLNPQTGSAKVNQSKQSYKQYFNMRGQRGSVLPAISTRK